MRTLFPTMLAATLAAPCAAAALPGIDALRGERRVVLASAPAPDDPRLMEQRRALAEWQSGAEDRDVTTVLIVGNAVEGAAGRAEDLRRRFALPPDRFAMVLIGKDGHVAVRSAEPVGGGALGRTIDAMPMRRAGQR